MDEITEARLQYECYSWFHNSYPNLRGLLCYNLSNSRNRIEGNKNKAMGLQPGRSDMVLYYKAMAYHIELKLSTGYQSKEQKEWEALLVSHGFYYSIARSLQEFQTLIKMIIK